MEDDNQSSRPGPQSLLRIAPRRFARGRRRRPRDRNGEHWLQDEVMDALRYSPSGLLVQQIAERVPDAACTWHRGQTKAWHVEEVLRQLELPGFVRRQCYDSLADSSCTRWFIAQYAPLCHHS